MTCKAHIMKEVLVIIIFGTCLACHTKQEVEEPKASFEYAENIKFNHLYVVIDDSTYKYLFDSIPFFREFAYVEEADIDAGKESWSGKYISGNQDYLEIFKPGGAEGAELGDFGIAFMPNKMGTVDSLYSFLDTGADSIRRKVQTMAMGEGKTIPWFNAVAIYDPDSLAITPWVMEYTDTFMRMAGFTEEDLAREISHAEYTQRSVATRNNLPFDSANYRRLYERVTALTLELSSAEYNYFRKYLETFGFTESDSAFTRPDLVIYYQLNEGRHAILDQIDFELRKEVEEQSYAVGKIKVSATGRSASIILNE